MMGIWRGVLATVVAASALTGCGGSDAATSSSSAAQEPVPKASAKKTGIVFFEALASHSDASVCALTSSELAARLTATFEQVSESVVDCPSAIAAHIAQIPPGQLRRIALMARKAKLKRRGDLAGFVNPKDGTIFLTLEREGDGRWVVTDYPVLAIGA